jgi:hypothetical protein
MNLYDWQPLEPDNDPPMRHHRVRFFTCHYHGWDCAGKPCPQCRDGDAPRACAKHGWAHSHKGCPDCAAGH